MFGLHHFLHQLQRVFILPFGVRGDAVGRDVQLEIAHVGVVGAEQDAVVARNAGENHRLRAEVAQQRIERGAVERGLLRLQHEIVLRVGLQHPRHVVARHFSLRQYFTVARKSDRHLPKLSLM